MKKHLSLAVVVLSLVMTAAKAQTSKYAIGIFSDVMMEAPVYDTYIGVNGTYDLNNHIGVQAFVGYSDVHITTVGADYIYTIFDKARSNFNIYGSLGLSGDFYKQKVLIDYQGTKTYGYAKANFLALNPTAGISYYFHPIRATVLAGYKVKYYPFEDAVDINYLSTGIRFHF